MTTSDNTQAPRHNRAFWQEHTDQWKQSGLSKIAYSKEHNLKPVSFYNWSKKLDSTQPTSTTLANTATTFVPVQIDQRNVNLPNAAQFVHVERAATVIALPVDLSCEQIQHWLQAIHALHV